MCSFHQRVHIALSPASQVCAHQKATANWCSCALGLLDAVRARFLHIDAQVRTPQVGARKSGFWMQGSPF